MSGGGVDAVVMAGGRVTGLYARAAGTGVKALAPIRGRPLLRRVLDALAAVPAVGRMCVVGPEETRAHSGGGVLWQAETGSALGNALAGIERLGPGDRRVLLCAADLPVLEPASLEDFLARAPEQAEICMPLVTREAFTAAFPGDLGIFVRLADGAFTAGGQALVSPGAVRANRELLARLFRARKSQIAMAGILGAGFVWRLVTRRLGVGELEDRASRLTGCHCGAVRDCRPDLAFDVDSVLDLRYIEGWLRRREGA